MRNQSKLHKIEDTALIILFMTALALPALGLALHVNLTPAHNENRILAPFPTISLNRHAVGAFPEKFRAYFQDHFGFRNTLIRWQALARVRWLGVSSSSQVMLGKDGWLFYAAERSIESYRGTDPFTPEQLARWQHVLEARRDWLARRNIRYLFTIGPDKPTIYPEYMPDSINKVRPQSRFDQLIAYLREHSDIQILDLRPALYDAKKRRRTYYRTDTHWNLYGGFIAYRAIIEELAKSFPEMEPPLSESDFEISTQEVRGMGDAAMLGLDDVIREEDFTLRPLKPYRQFPGDSYSCEVQISDAKESSLPRLVMFRDSFSNAVIPYLDHHFSHAVYVCDKRLDPGIVEAERPNVVIQEMVERFLMLDPPEDPPEIR
jgi:hypothetical protein